MQLVNIDYIPGKEFEALGIAKGTVVYSKNFGKDFMAVLSISVYPSISPPTKVFIPAIKSLPKFLE